MTIDHASQANSHSTSRRKVGMDSGMPGKSSDGEIRIKYMDSGKTQGMTLSKLEILGKGDNS